MTIEEREVLLAVKAAAKKYARSDFEGSSFRNYTAAIILQGLVSNNDYLIAAKKAAEEENGDSVQLVAQAAVEYTDALINELKKEK